MIQVILILPLWFRLFECKSICKFIYHSSIETFHFFFILFQTWNNKTKSCKWWLIDWKNNILNQIMLCHGELNENYEIFDFVHKKYILSTPFNSDNFKSLENHEKNSIFFLFCVLSINMQIFSCSNLNCRAWKKYISNGYLFMQVLHNNCCCCC